MKHLLNGPRREKTCLRGFANNKGADQPAHPRRLISAFVIRFLESNISKLAPSKISIFYLVSVAEQTGLNLTLSETPKTGLLATRPKWELLFSAHVYSHFPYEGTITGYRNMCMLPFSAGE